MGEIFRFAEYRAARRHRVSRVVLRLIRTELPTRGSSLASTPQAKPGGKPPLRRNGPFALAASPWRSHSGPPRPANDTHDGGA